MSQVSNRSTSTSQVKRPGTPRYSSFDSLYFKSVHPSCTFSNNNNNNNKTTSIHHPHSAGYVMPTSTLETHRQKLHSGPSVSPRQPVRRSSSTLVPTSSFDDLSSSPEPSFDHDIRYAKPSKTHGNVGIGSPRSPYSGSGNGFTTVQANNRSRNAWASKAQGHLRQSSYGSPTSTRTPHHLFTRRGSDGSDSSTSASSGSRSSGRRYYSSHSSGYGSSSGGSGSEQEFSPLRSTFNPMDSRATLVDFSLPQVMYTGDSDLKKYNSPWTTEEGITIVPDQYQEIEVLEKQSNVFSADHQGKPFPANNNKKASLPLQLDFPAPVPLSPLSVILASSDFNESILLSPPPIPPVITTSASQSIDSILLSPSETLPLVQQQQPYKPGYLNLDDGVNDLSVSSSSDDSQTEDVIGNGNGNGGGGISKPKSVEINHLHSLAIASRAAEIKIVTSPVSPSAAVWTATNTIPSSPSGGGVHGRPSYSMSGSYKLRKAVSPLASPITTFPSSSTAAGRFKPREKIRNGYGIANESVSVSVRKPNSHMLGHGLPTTGHRVNLAAAAVAVAVAAAAPPSPSSGSAVHYRNWIDGRRHSSFHLACTRSTEVPSPSSTAVPLGLGLSESTDEDDEEEENIEYISSPIISSQTPHQMLLVKPKAPSLPRRNLSFRRRLLTRNQHSHDHFVSSSSSEDDDSSSSSSTDRASSSFSRYNHRRRHSITSSQTDTDSDQTITPLRCKPGMTRRFALADHDNDDEEDDSNSDSDRTTVSLSITPPLDCPLIDFRKHFIMVVAGTRKIFPIPDLELSLISPLELDQQEQDGYFEKKKFSHGPPPPPRPPKSKLRPSFVQPFLL